MTVYFVDTSALAKRYIAEIGSNWVMSWIMPSSQNIIIVSDLTLVEMSSVFMRRQREGSLTPTNTAIAYANFAFHLAKEYLSVPLELTVITQAQQLTILYPLRTLDAIQLACAVQAAALLKVQMTFVSADNNLLKAAASEGFLTDNPNYYP